MSDTLTYDLAYIGEAKVPSIEDAPPVSALEGQWPRMIVLDEETENRLALWLEEEIEHVR